MLLWVFNKTNGFPKSKRFSLGQRLEVLFLDYISLINRYQYSKNKKRLIFDISLKFDEIKLLLKISYDAKLINKKSFAHTLKFTDEIGKIIGGLLKSKNN